MSNLQEKDLKHFLSIAVEASQEAGQYLREKWNTNIDIEMKGEINPVTEADKNSERMIIEKLTKHFPDHDILAEEGSSERKDSVFKWVIDPLDGTVNFAHNYPLFCTSIALECEGKIVLGVVYDPLRNELFHAYQNGGAYLNEKQIQVSQNKTLIQSLVATGFSYNFKQNKEQALGYFEKAILHAQGIRRDGVAAIDLCYVACGRYDAFFELNLFPWDVAAGLILIEEAGGRVSRFDDSNYTIYDKEILATNSHIHQEFSQILIK